jgi:hypothetical protein
VKICAVGQEILASRINWGRFRGTVGGLSFNFLLKKVLEVRLALSWSCSYRCVFCFISIERDWETLGDGQSTHALG